jgi:hypothetical protein
LGGISGLFQGGGWRLDLVWQADRLAQLRPTRLVIARTQEAVKVDGGIFSLLKLAKAHKRVEACSGDGNAELRPKHQANRIGKKIDGRAHRVTRRGRTPIGSHHVRAFSDSPDEQRLAEVAALLRQTLTGCKINKAAEAECRVHCKPRR